MSINSIFFNEAGDFEASRAAVKFLTERGFSVGRSQAHAPRGILFGDFDIQKWRNLRPKEREALHGEMTGDMRHGPVSVRFYDNIPPQALEALRSSPCAPSAS